MKNFKSRIHKLESLINSQLNEVVILVNLTKRETVEGKVLEKENELQKKINRSKMFVIAVSGLERI